MLTPSENQCLTSVLSTKRKPLIVDPHFSRAFPLDGEIRLLLRKKKFLKTKFESPLIFVYFFNEKQNKK